MECEMQVVLLLKKVVMIHFKIGKYTRCIIEGAVLVGISIGVESLFQKGYRERTEKDQLRKKHLYGKFGAIEEIIFSNANYSGRNNIRNINSVAMEEFLFNILGEDNAKEALYKEIDNVPLPLEQQDKVNKSKDNSSMLEKIISITANNSSNTKNYEFVGGTSDHTIDYESNLKDMSLVSPKEYCVHMVVKLGLQLGLSIGSIGVMNKLFGETPSIFSTMTSGHTQGRLQQGVGNGMWDRIVFNLRNRTWIKPHFIRRSVLLGLVGLGSYVVMGALIDTFVEEEELIEEQNRQLFLEKYKFDGNQSHQSFRDMNRIYNQFGSGKFMELSDKHTKVKVGIPSGNNDINGSVSGQEGDVSLAIFQSYVKENKKFCWPGSTLSDPFHFCRIIPTLVIYPLLQEGLLYSILFHQRIYLLTASRIVAIALTSLCYTLSKWQETDYQCAWLGYNPIHGININNSIGLLTLGDIDDDVFSMSLEQLATLLRQERQASHEDNRLIYNYARSLFLQLALVASGGNAFAPAAMYGVVNAHMLFDEFIMRTDFIKESSWCWRRMVEATAISTLIYDKFHDFLIRLRMKGVLSSHPNVINTAKGNKGGAVKAIHDLCEEGMSLFSASGEAVDGRSSDIGTCKEGHCDDWHTFVDFGYAFAMATSHLNQNSRIVHNEGGDATGNSYKHRNSAPLWKLLEENRLKYQRLEQMQAKEEEGEEGDLSSTISSYKGSMELSESFASALQKFILDSGVISSNSNSNDPVTLDQGGALADAVAALEENFVDSYLELFVYETIQLLTRLEFPVRKRQTGITIDDYKMVVIDHLCSVDTELLDKLSYEEIKKAMFYWEKHASEDDLLNLVEESNLYIKKRLEQRASHFGKLHNTNAHYDTDNESWLNYIRFQLPTYQTSDKNKNRLSSIYSGNLNKWMESCQEKEMLTTLRPYGLTTHRYQKLMSTCSTKHPNVSQLQREWNEYFDSDEWRQHLLSISLSV